MEAGMTTDTPRVLVADDQSDVLLALRLLLRDAGLQVDAAASIPEVRAKLESSEYDLLLMDLNYARDTTSGEEGLALLTEVHADDPLLPVLVMTGWGSIDTAVEAMRRGACGFVHKPWDNEALTAAIRRQVADGRTIRHNHDRASREQQEAQAIQRALLPMDMPHADDLDIAAHWKPASTFGGDLYDVTPLSRGRLAISVGDVCGKGLPAALLMANVQASVRAFAALEQSPAQVVTRLNHDLARHTTLRRFVTFFFGIYHTDTRRLTYCNAGHNPPMVMGKRGLRYLEAGGPVVGLLEFAPYGQETVRLDTGDTIIIFSDGVSEALNTEGEEFGDARLQAIAMSLAEATAQTIVDRIIADVRVFTRGAAQSDDITVMVIRYLGAGA
jgi:phosphoserine phosphatase RsbU/P